MVGCSLDNDMVYGCHQTEMHCCLLKLLLKGRGLGEGCRAKGEREEEEGRNRSGRKEGRGN